MKLSCVEVIVEVAEVRKKCPMENLNKVQRLFTTFESGNLKLSTYIQFHQNLVDSRMSTVNCRRPMCEGRI